MGSSNSGKLRALVAAEVSVLDIVCHGKEEEHDLMGFRQEEEIGVEIF